MAVQVVWFKRDLRIADHAPLHAAAARGPVVPLYIVEPTLIAQPDFDTRHWSWIAGSLRELRTSLAGIGQPLVVRIGDALTVLDVMHREVGIDTLWAHEETGNGVSYQRDRAVRAWCRQQGIRMHELPGSGVVRRLPTRDAWADRWEERMGTPLVPVPQQLLPVPQLDPGPIPGAADLGLPRDERSESQTPGERAAAATLQSFLTERGEAYATGMSSPVTAWTACSRLSPYLAWGNLSMRQAVHALRARQAEVRELPPGERGSWARSLSAFDARLHWRDHFIQKLEDEPAIEFRNFVRAYDGLRAEEADPERLEAWATGRTGYPLIDACMRALHATGWINFRMRAMLVSFASYDLWLHWREPGLHLARLFLDYEPGIHWSQHQMQAGTTGINTLRIYNPTKQAIDQDPGGVFIRRWVPELAAVPDAYIHQPWTMPVPIQRQAACEIGRDYPLPIVDHQAAVAEAKRRMYAVRRSNEARAQAADVMQRHGSRKRPSRRRPTGRRPVSNDQLTMPLDA